MPGRRKALLAGLGVVVLGFSCAAFYFAAVANPRTADALRSASDDALASKVMLLTLPSGRVLPVNYLREGDTVYAGADGPWWRPLRGEGAAVSVLIRGEQLRGHARAVEDDPARTEAVFSRLRPTVPSWLPDWLNGVLVAIELEGSGR